MTPKLLEVSSRFFLQPHPVNRLCYIQGICNLFFQVVITSPENLLSSQHLRPILTKIAFAKHVKIVVDEGHCISKWGPVFRPAWGKIGDIRALVPHPVPFLVGTATATPEEQILIKKSLHFDKNHAFYNLGNFRPNLVWKVQTLDSKRPFVSQLDFLIPPHPSAENFSSSEKVLVYVNDRPTAHSLAYHLRSRLPCDLEDRVEVYHALRSSLTKAVMTLSDNHLSFLFASTICDQTCPQVMCH